MGVSALPKRCMTCGVVASGDSPPVQAHQLVTAVSDSVCRCMCGACHSTCN